jgi:hypothetical protein
MNNRPKTCIECRFWDELPTEIRGNRRGLCRLHAPTILSGTGTGYSSELWPTTLAKDWCGELKPRVQENNGNTDS